MIVKLWVVSEANSPFEWRALMIVEHDLGTSDHWLDGDFGLSISIRDPHLRHLLRLNAAPPARNRTSTDSFISGH